MHLDACVALVSKVEGRRVRRLRDCGAWILVVPLRCRGTGVEAEEFRDALWIRYGADPEGMIVKCDGCGKKFSVEYALTCKIGEHVLACHNNVKDEWSGLCGHDLGRSKVFYEPLIKTSQDIRDAGETDGAAPIGDTRGDVAARVLWKRGQCAILYV